LRLLTWFVLLAAVLFDIAFPAVFQSWLDILSVLSLDVYTFIGEMSAPFLRPVVHDHAGIWFPCNHSDYNSV
jgi:hypothetical protein